MTLDEAILHAEEVADRCAVTDGNIQCENDHRQLAEWLKELKQLREQTRWISVSERLPKDDEDVLVCFEQGGMAVAYYHIDNTYYPTQFEDMNETGWFNEEDDAFYSEPIAWMPLPKPYKEESDGRNDRRGLLQRVEKLENENKEIKEILIMVINRIKYDGSLYPFSFEEKDRMIEIANKWLKDGDCCRLIYEEKEKMDNGQENN